MKKTPNFNCRRNLFIIIADHYMSEKGKNAATTEDIAIITEKVELVKNEFTKEQEFLKMDLQKALSKEVSYRDEERSSLIKFHGTISELLAAIEEVNFNIIKFRTNTEITKVERKLENHYRLTILSMSKIKLLVEQDNLMETSKKIYLIIVKHFYEAKNKINKLKNLIDKQNYLAKNLENGDTKIANAGTLDDQTIVSLEKIDDEKEQVINTFREHCIIKHEEFIKLEKKFTQQVQTYLKK